MVINYWQATGLAAVIVARLSPIVAGNGADWFISGAPDSRWNDEELAQIRQVTGKDLEVVYTGDIEQ